MLTETNIFMIEKCKTVQQLCGGKWIMALTFTMDIPPYLNDTMDYINTATTHALSVGEITSEGLPFAEKLAVTSFTNTVVPPYPLIQYPLFTTAPHKIGKLKK
jgi:hypothetical protein